MGDYYKLKKILIILTIVLCVGRIFKSMSSAATIVNPKEVVNTVFTYQYDNTFQTAVEFTLHEQERYILLFKKALNSQTKQQAINTLTDIYGYMVSTNPSKGLYFQTVLATNNNNFFAYHVCDLSNLTEANASTYIIQRNLNLDGAFILPNVPFLHQYRSSDFPSKFVDSHGITTTIIDYSDTIAPVPCIGVYNSGWADVFAMAGLIQSDSEYASVLNSINENVSTMNNNINSMNQTISNTYNYLTNEQHQEETSLPINEVETDEIFEFDDFYNGLNNILTNENYQTKTFNLKLPNNTTHPIAVDPNITYNFLTRIANGVYLVNLIQGLWYIAIFGIIIFDAKRMMNQVASGDFLNIMTDSSPVDNVVSASFSATGAIHIGTNHSGGDR